MAVLVFVVALTTGFILEDFGSLFERHALDEWLSRKDYRDLDEVWDAYLCLHQKDEIIEQRHLKGILLRLKFELSMAPALVALAIGLAWLNGREHFWSWATYSHVAFGLAIGVWFFLFEAHRSACSLAKIRELLVKHLHLQKPATFASASGSPQRNSESCQYLEALGG